MVVVGKLRGSFRKVCNVKPHVYDDVMRTMCGNVQYNNSVLVGDSSYCHIIGDLSGPH